MNFKSSFSEKEFDEIKKTKNGFLKFWCLKESYIKAIGKGLTLPLKDIEFTIDHNKPVLRKPLNNTYTFELFEPMNGYIAAICVNRKCRMNLNLIQTVC